MITKLLSKHQKYELRANSTGKQMTMVHFKFNTSKGVC